MRLFELFERAARARAQVGSTPADVIHRENKWRLLRYRSRAEGVAYRTPVLMVPSLINRHYVLDLMPGKSFVEWLVARGHDVYMIDWGRPGDEDRFLDFDTVCGRYIDRAVRRTARSAGSHGVHLLGYCLGGTLTSIYAAAFPERVATATTLAAPVCFEHAGALGSWTRTGSFDVDVLTEALGNVPWQLLQASFHMLRPTLTLSKIVGVLDRLWDDPFLDGFFALETWGNDNVSFPGACYRRYIDELYRGDALMKRRFRLCGRPADLENIRCPSLVVSFEHDSIVPEAAASPLFERVASADKQHIRMAGGHVGAVVSRKAATGLWPALAQWWEARDQAGVAANKPTPQPRPSATRPAAAS
jgi:polyhydroxyalkanoate synthase